MTSLVLVERIKRSQACTNAVELAIISNVSLPTFDEEPTHEDYLQEH